MKKEREGITIKEIWLPIKDFPNYQVSNLGRIKSLSFKGHKREQIIKPRNDKDGYSLITLTKDGKQYTFKVHRIVAQAFIENPFNKPCVDHINTVRNDNRAENLRWVTVKENRNNPITLKKSGAARKGKYTGENSWWYGKHLSNEAKEKISKNRKGKCVGAESPVARRVICLTTFEIFDTIKEAAEKYNIKSFAHITSCCRGNRNSCGKLNGIPLQWKYL